MKVKEVVEDNGEDIVVERDMKVTEVVEDNGEDVVVERDMEVTEVVEDNGEDVVVERHGGDRGCGGQWRGRCGGETWR